MVFLQNWVKFWTLLVFFFLFIFFLSLLNAATLWSHHLPMWLSVFATIKLPRSSLVRTPLVPR